MPSHGDSPESDLSALVGELERLMDYMTSIAAMARTCKNGIDQARRMILGSKHMDPHLLHLLPPGEFAVVAIQGAIIQNLQSCDLAAAVRGRDDLQEILPMDEAAFGYLREAVGDLDSFTSAVCELGKRCDDAVAAYYEGLTDAVRVLARFPDTYIIAQHCLLKPLNEARDTMSYAVEHFEYSRPLAQAIENVRRGLAVAYVRRFPLLYRSWQTPY